VRTAVEGVLKEAIACGNAVAKKDIVDAVAAIRATGKTEITPC